LDLLARGKEAEPATDAEDADGEDDEPATTGSGSKTRLKPWRRRTAKDLGEPANDGTPPPLIDCIHRTMRLWKTGEQSRVDGYLEAQGLWRNDLFEQVVQAVLELAKPGTDERATLALCAEPLGGTGPSARAKAANAVGRITVFTSLRLKDFKNFADETLRMGAFTVIVGANASGKSNIRDALRFLHGVGRGYTLAEALGGKYGAGGQAEWEAIRGAPAELVRHGQESMCVGVDMELGECEPDVRAAWPVGLTSVSYSIGLASRLGAFRVIQEDLLQYYAIAMGSDSAPYHHETPMYTSKPEAPDPVAAQDDEHHLLLRMAKAGSQKKYGDRVAVRPDQPALTQIESHRPVLKTHKAVARHVAGALADMRFLDPAPRQMREPAYPGQVVLGDGGENLPTVLQAICDDPRRHQMLLDWTRELTPMDVADFRFAAESSGKIQLSIAESNGKATSSQCVSDGTLRFLGMLAALLGEGPRLCVFEEIDNGIHPSRLHLLVELIEEQTRKGDLQVVTTTHSPDLLATIGDETFQSTSVVCRCAGRSDAIIRPVTELPNVDDLRHTRGIDRLHATGWMENILFFTEPDQAGVPT